MSTKIRSVAILISVVALAVTQVSLAADEDPKWTDAAELSLVSTSGNSESSSFGFKNDLVRNWEKAKLVIRLGGIRVDSTVSQTVTAGSTNINTETAVTAENYYLNGRYGRNISEKFFWYGGAGWERNEFKGFNNRTVVEAGVGNIWYDREDLKFSTVYAVTYTDQEDVILNPLVDDTFAGWRVGWNYENQWGKSTTYNNLLTIDGNLDESSDWRADMYNGLAVTMSEKLALKVGYQLLYENEPALGTFAEVNASGALTGNTVVVQLDELDTILTMGLVINFK